MYTETDRSASIKIAVSLALPRRAWRTLNIAYRTLSRRKKEGRFKTDESERVLRIAKLYEKALDVVEDDEITRQWFKLLDRFHWQPLR